MSIARVVSIAANGNGAGKTTAMQTVLRAHPGSIDAVKFTTVYRDGVNCPRTERACACRELHGDFTVVTDPATLSQPDTDTGRLARAGARSVIWCLARPGSHGKAWRHLADDLLAGGRRILTEGNSIVPILEPDLLLVVLGPQVPRDRWKPDTMDLIRRADCVVLNEHGASRRAIEELAASVAGAREGRLPAVEDVSAPLERWRDPTWPEAVEAWLAGSTHGSRRVG